MSTVAKVLHSARSEITFLVDAVKPGKTRQETHNASSALQAQTGRPLLAWSHAPDFQIVKDEGHHPLVSAVHLAFSRHHPLVLTPDAIWMTIAQGIAQHINNNPEKLRPQQLGTPQLVRHDGKMDLIVEVEALSAPEDWADAIALWAEAIEHNVSADMRDLMLCDFSTTTPTIRTASAVVMMDALRSYFDYHVYCICGIPQITLQGTVDDWRTIRNRVEGTAHLDLAWWTSRLLPICDGFIATAEGAPSEKFWREMYKPQGRYGGEVITGWLADLFPYIKQPITDSVTIRNPILLKSRSRLKTEDGISAAELPTGLSQAPATLRLQGDSAERGLLIVGGFVGVTQDPTIGSMQPEIGWAVQEGDSFAQILDRLKREHSTRPPSGKSIQKMREELRFWGFPAEVIQIWEQFDGAELFKQTSHPWRIRSCRDYTLHYMSEGYHGAPIIRFADLKDGRAVGFTYMSFVDETDDADEMDNTHEIRHSEWWIVIGALEPKPPHKGVKLLSDDMQMVGPSTQVIARGVQQFFERLLEAEGRYYFDDCGFVPDAAFVPKR